MRIFIVLLIGLLSFATPTFSQVFLKDVAMEKNFAAKVKSMEEFIGRFNGTELTPGNIDASRELNIISLFNHDIQIPAQDTIYFRTVIDGFISKVVNSDIQLKIFDSQIFAEVDCEFLMNKKKISLNIVLQEELLNSGYRRWAIKSVTGLQKAGLIDTTKVLKISPVENEVNFMGLSDVFEAYSKHIVGFLHLDETIDETSYFMGLVHSGILKFDSVQCLTYHCFDVPGYFFKVENFIRNSPNSGWLISSVQEMSDDDKKIYLKDLKGK